MTSKVKWYSKHTPVYRFDIVNQFFISYIMSQIFFLTLPFGAVFCPEHIDCNGV